MEPDSLPRGIPLFIGSLPFSDHRRALHEVLRRTPQSPHWVQLPVHPEEGFLVQFLEGAPGFGGGVERRLCPGSSSWEEELLSFYEDYLEVTEGRRSLNESRFVVSPGRAPGLYLLREVLSVGSRRPFVKGQISGPLTVLLGVHDREGRAAYYDEQLRDAVVKLLALKARWQAEFLAPLGHSTLVFVDEPALGGLGSSAYISISTQEALEGLKAMFYSIREAGAWPGVHVCANTDWGALLDASPSIVSFDAFSFFDRFVLYRDAVLDYLDNGGLLAWGIVPTDVEALRETAPSSLMERWRRQAEELGGAHYSPEDLLHRSFLTPSCGLGSLSEEEALRVMDHTVEVSDGLRRSLLGVSGPG